MYGGSTICCKQSLMLFFNKNMQVSYVKNSIRYLVDTEFHFVTLDGSHILLLDTKKESLIDAGSLWQY